MHAWLVSGFFIGDAAAGLEHRMDRVLALASIRGIAEDAMRFPVTPQIAKEYTAAGTLLIQEAGGRVGTPAGSEYALGPNVIAGNPKVYQALLEALGPLTPAGLRA